MVPRLRSRRELRWLLTGNKTGKFKADFSFKGSKCIAPIASGRAHSPWLPMLWSPPAAAAKTRASAALGVGTWLFSGQRPQKVLVASSPRSRQPPARPVPPAGLQKQTAERARPSVRGFARSSLSGSHGHGCRHPRPHSAAAACHHLPLRSPAPGQHHSIEGRRDLSPGGRMPHSCNEFVGALLSLTVPSTSTKAPSPNHLQQTGNISFPKTPQITQFSRGSPSKSQGRPRNKAGAGWVIFGANAPRSTTQGHPQPTPTPFPNPHIQLFFFPSRAFAQVSFRCCQRGARGRTNRGQRSKNNNSATKRVETSSPKLSLQTPKLSPLSPRSC